MPLSRRRFLGGTLATAATLPLALPLWARHALAASGPDIVDVSGKDPKAMVAAALQGLGGIRRFVRRGTYVVLKPNAGFANPAAWATTTHPETVAAVAQACLDAGAKAVTVLEYPQGRGAQCLDRCGLTAALRGLPKVKVKVLGSPADFQRVEVKGGVQLKQVEVAKAVLSADVLISIPAAKAHNETGVSFSLKNSMGLIHDRKAFHTMLNLHQAVADLARVVKPQLVILDATRVLLTNGPTGPGETATPGRIVAGRNPVSVDAYGLTLARFNNKEMTPADVKHLELCARAGLGEARVARLKVKKVSV
jgi:uncharacterized protein (DUF362 family)